VVGDDYRGWKPSHASLSNFLDDLTYRHAFNGGAIHGGWAEISPHRGNLQEFQKAWLLHHWHRVSVDPWVFYAEQCESFTEVPLYVCDGQALVLEIGLSTAAVTCSTEALDEISQVLQITWNDRDPGYRW
jgi:hypothetical protein